MWLALATVVQYLILGVLAVAVLSLARQIGILHERTAPAALVRSSQGVQIGEIVPPTTAPLLSGGTVGLGDLGNDALQTAAAADRKTLLLFVAPDCPICKTLLPIYPELLDKHAAVLTAYLVGDGMDVSGYQEFADEFQLDPANFLVSQELGLTLGVRQLPAAVLLSPDNQLLLRETVTGPKQLQRLVAQAAMPSGENNT